MKFKEILKNKWAWAGAVIGFFFPWYGCNYININGICSGASELGIIAMVITAIVGFVLGLILNKLYRKFK